MDWRPTASFDNLRLRAQLLAKIRAFFADKKVMEVETPLLSHATVTDLHLQSFTTLYQRSATEHETLYLQTSPEYAMKRLLAAGSGPIYQITKAFRNDGEQGRLHNPEFTLLEWYRLGFDHHALMVEMDELLQYLLATESAEWISYAELFAYYADIDPHNINFQDLKQRTKILVPELSDLENYDATDCLQLILSHIIEPQLGQNNRPTFLYDFPASQAALARIRPGNPPVAERFEVYIAGVELANGFHELSDPHEQRQRFNNDLLKRQAVCYSPLPIDEHFLAALQQGLPACAGVALGLDRLFMLAAKASVLSDVISFPITHA